MACKIRLHGTVDEVGEMLMTLKESDNIKILSESKVYEDRNSEYIRIYLDTEVKKEA
jgi:hypothetical protein